MAKPTRGQRAFHSAVQLSPNRPPRHERVAKQLREELSQMMIREMKDPRVRMASISEVRLSHDMKTARVMVSAIGEEKERHMVVVALRHAEGYLRGQIGARLENLKVSPHLIFELDESIAYSVRIASVLRELADDASVAGENSAVPDDDPQAGL